MTQCVKRVMPPRRRAMFTLFCAIALVGVMTVGCGDGTQQNSPTAVKADKGNPPGSGPDDTKELIIQLCPTEAETAAFAELFQNADPSALPKSADTLSPGATQARERLKAKGIGALSALCDFLLERDDEVAATRIAGLVMDIDKKGAEKCLWERIESEQCKAIRGARKAFEVLCMMDADRTWKRATELVWSPNRFIRLGAISVVAGRRDGIPVLRRVRGEMEDAAATCAGSLGWAQDPLSFPFIVEDLARFSAEVEGEMQKRGRRFITATLLMKMSAIAHDDFGYVVDGASDKNKEAIRKMVDWWNENRNFLYYDKETKRIEINKDAKEKRAPVDPDSGGFQSVEDALEMMKYRKEMTCPKME